MLKKFINNLEDPNNPLLGPTLWGLRNWGMWQTNPRLSVIYNIIHILAVIFVMSQYIELWIIKSDLEMAMKNLSVTMLSTVCIVKAGTFVFWQKHWRDAVEYVSTLEKRQLLKKDKITEEIIGEYTRYSRSVTYFYWSLVTATVFTVILAPLTGFISPEQRENYRTGKISYPEIMSSWVPFDKTRGCGYWVVVLEQSLICFYGGGIVANYDSNAIVLMSFFAGQLKLLSANCARLFGDDNEMVNSQEAMERICECHYHHVYLVKCSKIVNSLLSPVMFLYIIICSLMICGSAIQLAMEGTTNMQKIWIAEYLMALIAQLFLYCWHSNEVFFMSGKIEDGVYMSVWWSREVHLRRDMLLLGGQLRRIIVFTAGPFTKMTVATFVAILKGSYSYYTLLNK